jgi:hypothetical protein
MDITQLAHEAAAVLDSLPYDLSCKHGFEVAPGFFTLYNTQTGQCKAVLFHLESGLVFKPDYTGIPTSVSSRRVVGSVTFEGKTYPVRLPENHQVQVGDRTIIAQEYVYGSACDCESPTCSHCRELRVATKCNDTHRGNWKISGDEIVLFDFEGIRLD